jgi:hypothetical protein
VLVVAGAAGLAGCGEKKSDTAASVKSDVTTTQPNSSPSQTTATGADPTVVDGGTNSGDSTDCHAAKDIYDSITQMITSDGHIKAGTDPAAAMERLAPMLPLEDRDQATTAAAWYRSMMADKSKTVFSDTGSGGMAADLRIATLLKKCGA